MKTYLEPQEVERMEQKADNLRDRLLVRLLFRTGCRVSEALALGPQDVDLQGGTVTIQHLKARVRLSCPHCGVRLGLSHRHCPGCGAAVEAALREELERRRVRTLPVDSGTLEMVQRYVKGGGPVHRNGHTLLFGIARHQAWKVVTDLAGEAGLPRLVNPENGRTRGVSPHRLRDAHAVRAVKRDDSTDGVRMLQEMLGHSSIATTMKYRKVAATELRDWYERMWEED